MICSTAGIRWPGTRSDFRLSLHSETLFESDGTCDDLKRLVIVADSYGDVPENAKIEDIREAKEFLKQGLARLYKSRRTETVQ